MSRSHQVVFFASLLTVSAAAGGIARAADPSTGECLGATESSLSLRHQHKLREARAKALICSAPSCPGDIREECVRRVGEINAAIPTIVFDARDADGGELVAVRVSMDGQLLTDHLDGSAVAIDPGPHTFTFEAAGQPRAEKKLIIREGQKDRNEVVTLGTRKVAAAPAPAPAPKPAPAPAPAPPGASEPLATPAPVVTAPGPSPAPATSSDGHGQRVAAVTVGIVGVAALGAGVYFSYLTHSLETSVMNAGTFNPSDDSSGHTAHTMQFVMYGAGAAALATAVILYAVAPSGQEQPAVALAPAIGPHLAGGTLEVRF